MDFAPPTQKREPHLFFLLTRSDVTSRDEPRFFFLDITHSVAINACAAQRICAAAHTSQPEKKQ